MANQQKNVLVAGASGYLGQHIITSLQQHNYSFIALARSPNKLLQQGLSKQQIFTAQATIAESLQGCCENVDVVISCLGITKQKDGLDYMAVDYQANHNLLCEAERAGVKKFLYVSAFHQPMDAGVRLLQAKEKFAKELLQSTKLSPCVIRPNGFFADLEGFYQAAKTGSIFLLGDGKTRLNPIHGADLADFCVAAIDSKFQQLEVGGPETLTINDIAQQAFACHQRQARIHHLPEWLRRPSLALCSWLPQRSTGAAEFFLAVSRHDMIAPSYGVHKIGKHFEQLKDMELRLPSN